jgi:uncharacterized protein
MTRSVLVPALLAATLAAGLLVPSSARTGEALSLMIATGSPSGVYHPLGEMLARTWTREIEGIQVEAESSDGSVANLRALEAGDAQLAFVQTDIARYAVAGEELFSGEAPLDAPRALAMLYPEPIQIVTLAGAGIATVEDLEGRRVAIGARGSGTALNARQILAAHDLGPEAVHTVLLPFADAAEALRNRYIDAAFVTAGAPTGAVANLGRLYGEDVALVPIAPDRIAAIVERWPHYAATTIPAGSYPHIGTEVTTVAVHAMLVASAELEPATVTALLENLFSQPTLSRLCTAHRRGCDITRGQADTGVPIAFHPGATVYYGLATARAD